MGVFDAGTAAIRGTFDVVDQSADIRGYVERTTQEPETVMVEGVGFVDTREAMINELLEREQEIRDTSSFLFDVMAWLTEFVEPVVDEPSFRREWQIWNWETFEKMLG